MRREGWPARLISQPPAARLETPPPGSRAPEAISVQATRRAIHGATASKKNRNTATNARQERSSRPSASTTQLGRMVPMRSKTSSSSGTLHTSATARTTSRAAVARRRGRVT